MGVRYHVVAVLPRGVGQLETRWRRLRRACPRSSPPTERLARSRREARAISALNHPNVCTVYDVGESEGTHLLVMELIEGRPLSEAVADG